MSRAPVLGQVNGGQAGMIYRRYRWCDGGDEGGVGPGVRDLCRLNAALFRFDGMLLVRLMGRTDQVNGLVFLRSDSVPECIEGETITGVF